MVWVVVDASCAHVLCRRACQKRIETRSISINGKKIDKALNADGIRSNRDAISKELYDGLFQVRTLPRCNLDRSLC